MILMEDLFLIAGCILVLGSIVALCFKMDMHLVVAWGIFYSYIIALLGLTLFPIPYQAAPHMDSVPHNFIPLKTIISTLSNGLTRTAAIQIGGNILIAAPYGIFLSLVTRKKRLWKLLLLAMLFPCIIE